MIGGVCVNRFTFALKQAVAGKYICDPKHHNLPFSTVSKLAKFEKPGAAGV